MASNLAKENNIILSNPLLNSVTYPLEQQFNFKPVTCTEVQCIIMAMPKNKSPGPDKINMRIIRDNCSNQQLSSTQLLKPGCQTKKCRTKIDYDCIRHSTRKELRQA